MEVGNNDVRALERGREVGGDEVALAVVVVGVVGEQNAEAVTDGDARGDHEEAV